MTDGTENGLRDMPGKRKKKKAAPRQMGLREAAARVYLPKVAKAAKDYFFDTSKNYRNMHKLPKDTVPFSDPAKRPK